MKLVKFTQRERVKDLHNGNPLALFYDTSTNAPLARNHEFVISYSDFSPFNNYGGIPIPGSDTVSDSVEGVWQGLKVIDGRIDPSYFRGDGRKRDGRPQGHQYGERIIRYKQARQLIFIPTYEWMVRNCVEQKRVQDVMYIARQDIPQFFFDVDSNGDSGNLNSPLAHSAVLVDIINRELQKEVKKN